MSVSAEASVNDSATNTGKVIVYSKNSCVQCNATFRMLDNTGIEYQVIKIDEDEAAYEHVKSLGFLQAPVIVTPTDSWSGFMPDKIAALGAANVAAARAHAA